MFDEENMRYMEHNNIKIEHLNQSLLHLNKYRDSIIANNFLTSLKERLFDNGIPDETEDSNEIVLEVAKTFHSNLGEVETAVETPFNGVDIYQNNIYVGSHGFSNITDIGGPKPDDIFNKLRDFCAKNKKNLIASYLNINSIQNKFESLKAVVCNNLDIITIAETKLDSMFTTSQFMIDGFIKPFRYD